MKAIAVHPGKPDSIHLEDVPEPTILARPLDHGPLRAALGDRDDWRRRYRELIESGEELGRNT